MKAPKNNLKFKNFITVPCTRDEEEACQSRCNCGDDGERHVDSVERRVSGTFCEKHSQDASDGDPASCPDARPCPQNKNYYFNVSSLWVEIKLDSLYMFGT